MPKPIDVTRRSLLGGLAAVAASGALPAQTQSGAARAGTKLKRVLAIGDVQTGFQHDSVSHALATMERVGRESGSYAMTIRTDSQLITKSKVWGTGRYAAPPAGSAGTNAKNLDTFDAVFFFGVGEGLLTAEQKRDLLAFVHEDGKGFVGAHSAIDAFYSWPEYGEMVGGYFDAHPWGTTDGRVIVERPGFPGMTAFVTSPAIHDEFYQAKMPYDRAKLDVLARLDVSKLDMTVKSVRRTDGDFPVAWAKTYGAGKVFWSTLGHPEENWDDARVSGLYLGALQWALGLEEYAVRPHAMAGK